MEIESSVRQIVGQATVWENHACMPLRADDSFLPQLERYRQSGYTVVSLNIGMDLNSIQEVFSTLAHFRNWVKRHPDRFLLINDVEDVKLAKAEGRLGICFDLEGAAPLGGQLSMIEMYYELGVRWMLIAYNRNNDVGGGCLDDDQGLTDFGRSVLDEMTRVGMVPCCSHTGWRTAREVMDHVEGPVIFSHSNAYAVYEQPRNIPDDLIVACAATGGVVGLNGLGRFIGKDLEGNLDSRNEALFRHLDHMVQLVGPDHVGIGFDYVFDVDELVAHYKARPDLFPPSRGYPTPAPMVEPERLPSIVQMMLDRGYPPDTICKILGGNHLRVAQAAWK
ncbi:membrane dipeptidase [Paraburkholderia sp. GAS206C]|jgi:membrane dipeptidase|uniref:dipeptidase n=1 Tax=unclassified Paraburkholderia TaxID=2615204 RepID=UPI003D1B199C